MDVNLAYWNRRENGAVEWTELPRAAWVPSRADGLIDKQYLCRWRSPYQLTEELPGWFDFCLVGLLIKDGSRRFIPVDHALASSEFGSEGLRRTAGALEQVASLAGHAILKDRGELNSATSLTYDEARLFLQYVCHMREHFGPTTKLGQALRVCSGGRADSDSKNILPSILESDTPNGSLRAEGLAGARAAGYQNPTPDQILRFGLLEAAGRNSIDVPDEETVDLVRLALFDAGATIDRSTPNNPADSDELPRQESHVDRSESLMTYVARHVKESLRDHQHDTTEEFGRWIEDRKSNLVHRISKRKDCPWSREQVRAALLELGWEAFQMLGRCIDAQFRAFRAALPLDLNADDDALFAHAYLANPAFGGLPLLILRERLDFLREAILGTWSDPNNRQAIAVVHTMMHYYAEMASNRRSADRRYKRRAQHRNEAGRVSGNGILIDDTAVAERSDGDGESDWTVEKEPSETSLIKVPTSESADDIGDIVDHLRELRGIECPHGCSHWGHEIHERDEMVAILLDCECGRTSTRISLSRTEFIQVARDFLGVDQQRD